MLRLINRTVFAALLTAAAVLAAGIVSFARPPEPPPATPGELSATYGSIADVMIAAKKAEVGIVAGILDSSYGHAQARIAGAKAAMKGGNAAGATDAVESVASLVGQMATEGDSSIAGIRKRLLDNGHHHHAKAEQQGIYDEGYVVVTKAAKTALLESSKAFGVMAKAPTEGGLDKEWARVQATYESLKKK